MRKGVKIKYEKIENSLKKFFKKIHKKFLQNMRLMKIIKGFIILAKFNIVENF